MWKPYVKWESNLILLRLAAHLVDGQKLTRGLAIYLIGHKIRVCTSLSIHTLLCLLSLPTENEGDAARPSFSSTRLSEVSRIQVGGKAAFSVQARAAAGIATVHARDKHANGGAMTPDKTLSVGASLPASDDCSIQKPFPALMKRRIDFAGTRYVPVTQRHQQVNMGKDYIFSKVKKSSKMKIM